MPPNDWLKSVYLPLHHRRLISPEKRRTIVSDFRRQNKCCSCSPANWSWRSLALLPAQLTDESLSSAVVTGSRSPCEPPRCFIMEMWPTCPGQSRCRGSSSLRSFPAVARSDNLNRQYHSNPSVLQGLMLVMSSSFRYTESLDSQHQKTRSPNHSSGSSRRRRINQPWVVLMLYCPVWFGLKCVCACVCVIWRHCSCVVTIRRSNETSVSMTMNSQKSHWPRSANCVFNLNRWRSRTLIYQSVLIGRDWNSIRWLITIC